MGRRISKEFLHPSILEGVNNKIGNLDSLETDAKGNMVQAINELVEKLDNSAEIESGKELIANAVGEPLTAEDSFDEMSSDINSLLSTFKTNMMNNGVTVESGDKFKSLIDKIATMVEEGEGKGIQYAEGELENTISNDGTSNYTFYFPQKLNFTPSILFISGFLVDEGNCNYKTIVSNIYDTCYVGAYGGLVVYTVTNISDESFSINIKNTGNDYYYNLNNTNINYYAIGVGEEDTTLRDSLASILTDEGVSVTEEDDMASLITKVDEEFDNKSKGIVTKAGTTYTFATIDNLPSENGYNHTFTLLHSGTLSISFYFWCSATAGTKYTITHTSADGTEKYSKTAGVSGSNTYSHDLTNIEPLDTLYIYISSASNEIRSFDITFDM